MCVNLCWQWHAHCCRGLYAQAATLLQNLLMVCLLALLHVNVLMYVVSRPLGKGAQAL